MAKKFSQRLLEWNLTEKDGSAVPPTRDGVLGQDRELFLILVRAWLDALASVSRPLPKPSSDGAPLAGVQGVSGAGCDTLKTRITRCAHTRERAHA